MSMRNQSPQAMFELLAREHVPRRRFDATNRPEFEAWKAATLPEVVACLGQFPDRVPLNAELTAEWEHHGVRQQRWMIDVQKHLSAAVLVNTPLDVKAGERRAAVFCMHGHGPYGKQVVMGDDSMPEQKAALERSNYAYGLTLAQRGYVTFSMDWIGFGERNDSGKPNYHNQDHGRDWCDLYYLHATMLGSTTLAYNVVNAQAALDLVTGFSFVDAARVGAMGLSAGGTMALWVSLCDARIRATEIICYSDLWADFGFRQINYCGMQVAPGLYSLVDLPDLQGLLAPRPLLADIGAYDTCFLVDSATACAAQVKRIYEVAGASDSFEVDLAPVEHAWPDGKSRAFWNRHLGEPGGNHAV